jgi:hypothetical protein
MSIIKNKLKLKKTAHTISIPTIGYIYLYHRGLDMFSRCLDRSEAEYTIFSSTEAEYIVSSYDVCKTV